MAISIVMVLAISSAAAVELVRSNQVASGRERQVARALGVAEAGLDKGALAVAAADPDAALASGSTLAATSYSFDGGSGQWSAAKQADGSWTVSAVAFSPNGSVERRLEVAVQPNQEVTGATVPDVYSWGFFMGDPDADCTVLSTDGDTIGNGAQVTVPMYIASSLCLSGGGSPLIAEPGTSVGTIPLYVGGKLRVQGNSSPVGTTAQPLASATIVQGCQVYRTQHGGSWKDVICSTPESPTSGTGSGVHALTYSSQANVQEKPDFDSSDADDAYASAAPGPNNPCGAGSTIGPLRFDSTGSTTRDTSLGTVRLLYMSGSSGSANNFDCRFYDGSGNLVGRLAWTFGSPGTLIIQGKVFIDGNLYFTGNDKAVYQGSGTIYVNGTVTFDHGAHICGAAMDGLECSTNWDPDVASLEIVAINANNASPGWSMLGDAQFEGISYTNGRYVSDNGAWTQGPVIADSGTLAGATEFKKIDHLPSGSIGSDNVTTTTNWGIRTGSWRECPPADPCPALAS